MPRAAPDGAAVASGRCRPSAGENWTGAEHRPRTGAVPPAAYAETKQPAVCAIDVAKGRIARLIPVGTGAPGNLLIHGGQLISQGPLTVTAYPLVKEERE